MSNGSDPILKMIRRWMGIAFTAAGAISPAAAAGDTPMEHVVVSADHRGFALTPSQRPFTPWGFNYDHDGPGRLIEDYWHAEWPAIEQDFAEMKALGATVVRIHLQFGKFVPQRGEPSRRELERLRDLLELARRNGLRLDLTGLACYHKADVPAWYDRLDEASRWQAQTEFWQAVAAVGQNSPAVFCYDLMNEPILPGAKKPATEWLTGELGGKFFVQRLTLDMAGRTREEVAAAWVNQMVAAIRKVDTRHLITVGVIPLPLHFPGAKPLFYAPQVGAKLDFASVHFYPESGKIDQAIKALAVYDTGKPVVIEETFALKCKPAELADFIRESRRHAAGWISFYWGKSLEEYRAAGTMRDALTGNAIEAFIQTREIVLPPP